MVQTHSYTRPVPSDGCICDGIRKYRYTSMFVLYNTDFAALHVKLMKIGRLSGILEQFQWLLKSEANREIIGTEDNHVYRN